MVGKEHTLYHCPIQSETSDLRGATCFQICFIALSKLHVYLQACLQSILPFQSHLAFVLLKGATILLSIDLVPPSLQRRPLACASSRCCQSPIDARSGLILHELLVLANHRPSQARTRLMRAEAD